MQTDLLVTHMEGRGFAGSYDDKVRWMANLPEQQMDAPEMFRLHGSAAKMRDSRMHKLLLESLLQIQVARRPTNR